MFGIIGKKLGMSQVFTEKGEQIPVTIIEAGPCPVVQVKTDETDGYNAVQVGFEPLAERKVNKPQMGHFKKAEVTPVRHLVEFRDFDTEKAKLGEVITVAGFKAGQKLKVTGTSKGKGFQGVVRRHSFSGGPKTHGQSDRLRAPGSIGQSAYPSRVIKGMRMAGHMGSDKVSVKNLKVVKVDEEKNLLFVKGAVPGAINGLLIIRRLER